MKDSLIEILTIIGYSEDKKLFADQFIELLHLKTLQNSLLTLPEDKQREVEEKILNARDQEEVEKIINENFSLDLYASMLKDMYFEMLKSYFEAIKPTLTENKLHELEKYLKAPAKKE